MTEGRVSDKYGSTQILDIFNVQPETFYDGLDVGYEKKGRQYDSKVFGWVTGKMMVPSTVRWRKFSDGVGLG